MSKVYELYGLSGQYARVDKALFGLECEIEQVANPGNRFGFYCKEDGSLRDQGYEFVSEFPQDLKTSVGMFKDLHTELKFIGDEPFSPRTSTHVHMNCCGLSIKQVKTLLMLYALFENVFFMHVAPERRDNIHCVPLTETFLPSYYHKAADVLVQEWHKYTAINLKRLRDLGTVEFRHMHGTDNEEEIKLWLTLLENLFNLCQRVEVNKTTLADNNIILMWFDEIFGVSPKAGAIRSNLNTIIQSSLIDVKLSIRGQ